MKAYTEPINYLWWLVSRAGARRWRKLHTLIVLAWLMSAAHTAPGQMGARRGSKLWWSPPAFRSSTCS